MPEAIAKGQSALDVMVDLGALTKVNFLLWDSYPVDERETWRILGRAEERRSSRPGSDPLPTMFVVGHGLLAPSGR